MIDLANIIGNFLIEYLPDTKINYGERVVVKNIEFDSLISNKVYLTFEPEDYAILSLIINNQLNPNNIFTVSNVSIKNQITRFEQRLGYGFVVNFELETRFSNEEIVTLKGFSNNTYNTNYKVLLSGKDVILQPVNNISIITVEENLGYISFAYNNGFNGLHSFTIENNNRLSYVADANLYNMVDDISKVDKTIPIYLYHLLNNIKVMDFDVFQQSNSEINQDFLIIDTASFNGTPVRSAGNNTDKSYNLEANIAGKIDRLYTARILYYLVRNIDDANNQTASGGDIVKKQFEMFSAISRILLNFNYKDNKIVANPITLVRDGVVNKTDGGSIIIQYDIEFSVCYNLNAIILPIDSKKSKLINRVKFNNQTMIINE
jgi:hypothetical protein